MNKYDILKHGVTQSMLGNFMKCREKAKLSLKGWSASNFSGAIQYGELFHGSLERIFKYKEKHGLTNAPSDKLIFKIIDRVAKELEAGYEGTKDEAFENLVYNKLLAQAQLPLYLKHNEKDFSRKKWTVLETEFNVPLTILAGGKEVTIPFRGKIDGGYEQDNKFRLFETKTKSLIDYGALVDMLHMDFQTSSYTLAALSLGFPFPAGILYNIIRRPQLRQRKTETMDKFIERVGKDIQSRPKWYFIRFNIAIEKQEMDAFIKEFKLIVRDFYLWHTGKLSHYKNTGACQDKYGACAFLPLCSRGETLSLKKRDKIFPELGEIK